VFEARHIQASGSAHRARLVVDDVSFAVRKGDVLGIAGLIGAGRTELLNALFGALPAGFSGEVLLDGRALNIRHPADAIANAMALDS
jgi:D-xylose transport system ATP-binding protein